MIPISRSTNESKLVESILKETSKQTNTDSKKEAIKKDTEKKIDVKN